MAKVKEIALDILKSMYDEYRKTLKYISQPDIENMMAGKYEHNDFIVGINYLKEKLWISNNRGNPPLYWPNAEGIDQIEI